MDYNPEIRQMDARKCDRMKAKHRPGRWQTQVSCLGFSCGSAVKESARSAGDTGWIPGSGRSPEGENGNTLQYSCLGNPVDRKAGWATIHRVTEVSHNLATKQQ